MDVVGKNPNQRRRVRIKPSDTATSQPVISGASKSIEAAAYVAEMCAGLVGLAKGPRLIFLAHLLRMAQAEAESVLHVRK